MSITPINIGTAPNDGTGDNLRAAFAKVNANTQEQQAGLALKANQTALDAGLALKEPAFAAGTAAQYWRGDKTWRTLDKAAVGLANVDNTSDANKPVSTAQAAAIAASTANNIHEAAAKITPADADELGLSDSAASWGLKKLTFANLKAWLAGLFVSKSGAVMAGDLTVPSLNSGQLAGMRNKIINGKMEIDKRNKGALVTVNTDSTNIYSVDRWAGLATPAAGVFTLEQETGPFATPTGRYPFALRVNVTTADASLAAADRYVFGQVIEGANVSDLNFGFSTARTVTLSFNIFSSLAGTYCVSLRNNAVNRSYVAEFTVDQANIWEYKTITIPGDTTGTWTTDNTAGLRVYWSLGTGSGQQTTAGSWQTGNFSATANQVNFMSSNSGRTLFITGVQLEVGSVATPFEHRPFGAELALCQMYYQRDVAGAAFTAFASGAQASTTQSYFYCTFPAMRTAPTFGFSNLVVSDLSTFSAAATLAASDIGTTSARLNVSHATNGAAFRPVLLNANNNAAAFVERTSEI